MEAFRIDRLNFTYPAQRRSALHDLSLTVRQGEFLLLCGASGSGKTTLLRCMKPSAEPQGKLSGEVIYFGAPLRTIGHRRESAEIGFVGQSPDEQLVTDQVWHELAFALESLGLAQEVIRRRVAESAAFFGLEPLFRRKTAELSGGQKQLLNLAAVLTLQPDVLILDEPTAQLDPIAASEFLHMLARIHRELGMTVVLSEHRLEEAMALCDRAAVLEDGSISCAGTPREVGEALHTAGSAMFWSMPAAMRIWAGAGWPGACPVSIREGQSDLAEFAAENPLAPLPPETAAAGTDEFAVEAREISYRFERDGGDVLRDLSLQVRKGEILAVLGGNGAGKSTLLRVLGGMLTPQRGRIDRRGRAALMPQDARLLFTESTLREELRETEAELIEFCGLSTLMDRHPYDLSGGEQQRAALAKLLTQHPDILLLDEPTKGMDGDHKRRLAALLSSLARQEIAVVLVSHDVEFCAEHAQRCALLFDGGIIDCQPPRRFFSGNSFYTTAANRIAREQLPEAVTVPEVIAACGGRAEPPPPPDPFPESDGKRLETVPPRKGKTPLPRRTQFAIFLDLLLIPLTLWWGIAHRGSYYLTALFVLVLAMLPFFLALEGRRPSAREIAVLASLCALGVAGRAAFFMLQQFKPVLALVVVTGAALGGEAGFLVGAVTMLVSNMFFGQGPWTPFQMFAMGLIGLLAGILHERGLLRPKRIPLCLYGAFAAVFLYGGLINPAAALLSAQSLNWGTLLSFYLTGLPMDLVQTAATVLFLWIAGEAMYEKIVRVKIKYGI